MRDEPLLDALRAGDEAAFERVVREHAGRLRAAARRIVWNEEDAVTPCRRRCFRPSEGSTASTRLAPLAPLVGKTWRGTVSPPGSAKPSVDVSRFELAINGQAVRNRHSIDDGAIVSHEVIKGAAGGISEVKAVSRLLPGGRLHVKSRHVKNGQWEDGRETFYVEEPQAVVRFKE